MANVASIKSPEEHKYIVIGEVHIAQILHQAIFHILLGDIASPCQVHHLKSINDVEVRLESQLNFGRFNFPLGKYDLFYAFNKLF